VLCFVNERPSTAKGGRLQFTTLSMLPEADTLRCPVGFGKGLQRTAVHSVPTWSQVTELDSMPM